MNKKNLGCWIFGYTLNMLILFVLLFLFLILCQFQSLPRRQSFSAESGLVAFYLWGSYRSLRLLPECILNRAWRYHPVALLGRLIALILELGPLVPVYLIINFLTSLVGCFLSSLKSNTRPLESSLSILVTRLVL